MNQENLINPLKISSEQKEKLLNMCKALFPEPEYDFWWEYEMSGRGLKQSFDGVLCIYNRLKEPITYIYKEKEYKQEDRFFNIHWLEFTMTELTSKLYKMFFAEMAEQDRLMDLLTAEGFYKQVLYHKTIHPVDYLYGHFIKLTTNNESK